jgi:hypothetical protein
MKRFSGKVYMIVLKPGILAMNMKMVVKWSMLKHKMIFNTMLVCDEINFIANELENGCKMIIIYLELVV